MGKTHKEILADATDVISGDNTVISLFGLRAYSNEKNGLILFYYNYQEISTTQRTDFSEIKTTLDKAIEANTFLQACALCPHIDFN